MFLPHSQCEIRTNRDATGALLLLNESGQVIHWLPLHGLGAHTTDDVALRSGMGACGSYPINYRDPAAVAALRRHLERYLKVRPLFAKDFYPLTDWSDESAKWLAFQFHDPTKGEGIIQAFCGANALQRSQTFKLNGLNANKQYTITDWDRPASSITLSGHELTHVGVEVLARDVDQAAVFHYTSKP